MRKENNFLDQIIEKENKEFENWKLSNSLFITNKEILSDFVNIEKNVKKNFIEFFLFNEMVLNKKYDLAEFGINIKSNKNSLSKNIEEIFKVLYDKDDYKDKLVLIELIEIYSEITKSKSWNLETEYEFVKKYWIIQDEFYKRAVKDYNSYFLFLNKIFFERQKGIKEYE